MSYLATLNALLKLKAYPAKVGTKRAQMPEMKEILDATPEAPEGYGLAQLKKYALALIQQQPKSTKGKVRQLSHFYKLLGQVLDHHILADETMNSYMTDLRKAAMAHHGKEDALKIINSKAGQFSNSKRTMIRNANNKAKRNLRHQNAYSISLARIRSFMNQLVVDIGNDPLKYKHAVPLLVQISLGCRISEVITAAKFEALPARHDIQYMKQTGVLKKRLKPKVGRGTDAGTDAETDTEDELEEDEDELAGRGPDDDDDEENPNQETLDFRASVVLQKPLLPAVGVTSAFLVTKLAEWRESCGLTDLIGTYDKKASARLIRPINALLQKRYGGFLPRKQSINDKEDKPITSHLLRSLYVAAAFKLYSTSNETLSKFLMDKLGHDDLEVGLNYNWVKILDDTPADEIKLNEENEVVPAAEEPNRQQDDDPNAEVEWPEDKDPMEDRDVAPEPDPEPKKRSRRKPLTKPIESDDLDESETVSVLKSEVKTLKIQVARLTKLVTRLVELKYAETNEPAAQAEPEPAAPAEPPAKKAKPQKKPAAALIRKSSRASKPVDRYA